MSATIRTSREIAALLGDVTRGVVFQQLEVGEDWDDVLGELEEAFAATQPAAIARQPVVYIVSSDALLGRTGRGNAMVATGLLSAARTLAAELKRDGVPVNVLGVAADTSAESAAAWVAHLLDADGPTGELVQLSGTQIGKALP